MDDGMDALTKLTMNMGERQMYAQYLHTGTAYGNLHAEEHFMSKMACRA